MCTILGQHISIIRPSKPTVHITTGAWKGAKQIGRKTNKLTDEMKKQIALEMGYQFKTTEK